MILICSTVLEIFWIIFALTMCPPSLCFFLYFSTHLGILVQKSILSNSCHLSINTFLSGSTAKFSIFFDLLLAMVWEVSTFEPKSQRIIRSCLFLFRYLVLNPPCHKGSEVLNYIFHSNS